MASAFVLQLDEQNLYLRRSPADGATVWTTNPFNAARFSDDMAAEAFARNSGIEGNISVQHIDFGPWG